MSECFAQTGLGRAAESSSTKDTKEYEGDVLILLCVAYLLVHEAAGANNLGRAHPLSAHRQCHSQTPHLPGENALHRHSLKLLPQLPDIGQGEVEFLFL